MIKKYNEFIKEGQLSFGFENAYQGDPLFKKEDDKEEVIETPEDKEEVIETPKKEKNLILFSKLSNLKEFLIYNLNMRGIIDNILLDMSSKKNYNKFYQEPLKILFETGKYPDIKKYPTGYWSINLKELVRVVDANGEYHPVNKLNTNYSDQADLLYDVLELLGKIEEIKKLNVADLKSWLKVFFSTNNVEEIIRDNFDVREYVSFNRKMSDIGEEAENFVAEYFKSKGFEILYQGGDGDWIDMIYGIDLIMKKGSVVYTVQVKSREGEAKKSLTNNKYSKIDLICSPVLDVIEDDTDPSFVRKVKVFSNKHPEGIIF